MMWLLLSVNVSLEYCTTMCMTRLVGATSALTATLVLTGQRFGSFVFSATYLNPLEPNAILYLGALCVVVGTGLYSAVPPVPPQQEQPPLAARRREDFSEQKKEI